MARTAILAIRIVSDASRAAKGFDQAESKAARFQRGTERASRAAGVGLAALGAAAISAGRDLARIETINAQTAAAIKSTGGAAGVSATHVENLSGRLEKLTATEAETVQESANLLLTFTKVRNGVGKGNQVFDRAVTAFVDMKRANPSASMNMLGKALNDPIAGISALSRVGVQFSKQQKEQIAAMVESGDVMGAQKVILKELETQYGGSGKAFAATTQGQVEQAKNLYGELAESLTVTLLPAFRAVVGVVLSVTTWLQKNQGVARVLAITFIAVASATLAITAAFKVYVAVTRAAAAATAIYNAVISANPLGAFILLLIAVAAMLVLLWKRSATFRSIVISTGRAAATAFQWVWSGAKKVAEWVMAIVDAIKQLIAWIKRIKWPKAPGWLGGSALGKLFGSADNAVITGGATSALHPAIFAAPGDLKAAQSGAMVSSRVGGNRGAGVQIIINGALDPVNVAKQIKSILAGENYRMGVMA